jgi:hypothetical protein
MSLNDILAGMLQQIRKATAKLADENARLLADNDRLRVELARVTNEYEMLMWSMGLRPVGGPTGLQRVPPGYICVGVMPEGTKAELN